MSVATADPKPMSDLLAAIRQTTPRQQMSILSELVRLHLERMNGSETPFFVWNEDDLVTAMLIPCAKPFDPNAHTKEPGYDQAIRREMEEIIRKEGPLIKLV